MANIYWCNEGTDLAGLYIVEDSRNKARQVLEEANEKLNQILEGEHGNT